MLRIGVIMYETSRSKGQELVAQRMVKEFNILGHEAYLITSAFQDWEPVVQEEQIARRGGYMHTYDEALGIPVLRVESEVATWPPRRINFRNFVGVLTQIVSDLKLNVLITHSTLWNGPEEATKFVVWNRQMASQGAHNPPILLCHMSHFQEASDERYAIEERTFRDTWNRISLREILGQSDYVLVTTPLEREQMRNLGASEDKFIMFPGGIDDEILDRVESSDHFRKTLGLPKSVKLVTALGTVEERKNALSVVEVAKALSQDETLHFMIAGKMAGEYAARVKGAADTMQNMTILGEITDQEKVALINETFVNITMSRSEALGIAQLEFLYRGVPVITSGVGGQTWVVKDGINGVVLKGPDDVEGARSAIASLASNPKYRKRLSEAAVRTSSQATVSNLVAGLSKKLITKLSHELQTAPLRDSKEQLIEARVHAGRRVAVTTKRIIVSSAKGGKSLISVPLEEIVGISRRVKRRWRILLVGLMLSAVGFVIELQAPNQFATVLSYFEQIPLVGASNSTGIVLRILLPLLPLFTAVVWFFGTFKEGYGIQYGEKKALFLERDFIKALRTVDSMVERRLFPQPTERLAAKENQDS
jgi:D-inositol-3-phosphate glycosyltransferase